MDNLTREEEKALRERTIFAEFAEVADLPVNPDSITSERPPAPDLSCAINGRKHHFEMSEVTDEGLAARLAKSIRTMKILGGHFRQDRPLLRVFAEKAKKNYQNLIGPLELVVYYDRQYAPPAGGLLESTQQELCLIAQSMLLGGWSRLWIYDVNGREVLWVADESMV